MHERSRIRLRAENRGRRLQATVATVAIGLVVGGIGLSLLSWLIVR